MPAIPAAVCTAGTHKGLVCDWCEHFVLAHSHVVEDDPVFTGASQCGTAIHKRNSRTHKRLAQSQLQLACCAFHKLTARWSTPAREWRPPAARPAYALLTAWRTAAEGEHSCQSEVACVPALTTALSFCCRQQQAAMEATRCHRIPMHL